LERRSSDRQVPRRNDPLAELKFGVPARVPQGARAFFFDLKTEDKY